MTRRCGRSPRGTRLVAKVPHRRWRTLTFLAALRCDRIEAPCVIDGPINGASFRAYVEQFLVPTLSAGDIVIMDNLGSHKGQAVRQLIRAAGAKLFFLPRYSPDLNPIEHSAVPGYWSLPHMWQIILRRIRSPSDSPANSRARSRYQA